MAIHVKENEKCVTVCNEVDVLSEFKYIFRVIESLIC